MLGMPLVFCVLMIQLVLISVQMFGVLLNEVGLERHLCMQAHLGVVFEKKVYASFVIHLT